VQKLPAEKPPRASLPARGQLALSAGSGPQTKPNCDKGAAKLLLDQYVQQTGADYAHEATMERRILDNLQRQPVV